MAVKVISPEQVEVKHLPGRDLSWFVSDKTIGTEQLSIALMDCPAHSVVKPLHAHKDVEEIILILEGQGEAYVDGETAEFKKGDAVLFPPNSKHQVRNTGDSPLKTASIFADKYGPDSYIEYDENVFEKYE
jgi:quercetin dioxygenase-like cupin family protein